MSSTALHGARRRRFNPLQVTAYTPALLPLPAACPFETSSSPLLIHAAPATFASPGS